jgi:hypothetical protein
VRGLIYFGALLRAANKGDCFASSSSAGISGYAGLGMKPVLVLMSALLVTLDELQFENGKLGFRSQYS